ncbi:alpha-E domain-containing protein [Gluconacetobacter entanii]|uniref:alpha-E domain-containing protein n=1 Tax=Gluconacetobacter entanii TaxID=108528 RepID=UPI001C9348BB|nr:alpha-E domain-containing protein [Gluconacetobacter entanii]MBY4640804.1 alpha-E domain-containing protein [Gluconacetobacter entanii]MCW4581171.1 alpha-E domain-containing protein [Gluconacetobacter entanii]MCW4584431.1 alpha-E domain-containing protein [Gluconacetobacter entanii]MCW4587905.1 alpha-E domain-containing protein [Gluconacetobacter entanii]
MGACVMTNLSVFPTPVLPGLHNLLSRYAESMTWMARYMERIENLARLIEVTGTFVRPRNGHAGWDSVLQINADEARFFAMHEQASEHAVVGFYITERDNPGSIAGMAHAVRENARALRPLISTEMWMHLNVFTQWVRDLTPTDIRAGSLSGICTRLKQECQTHFGITEGTLYRDQAWLFYVLGKHLERADQITRLLDIKYHTLLPRGADVGSDIDISQWTSVLRSAAAYHAFRRVLPSGMTPVNIVGFLLKNDGFPRSLSTSLRQVHSALGLLAGEYRLRHGSHILERVEELRVTLAEQTAEEIISRGLHEYMEWIQCQLRQIQEEIVQAYWPTAPMPVGMAQGQVQ